MALLKANIEREKSLRRRWIIACMACFASGIAFWEFKGDDVKNFLGVSEEPAVQETFVLDPDQYLLRETEQPKVAPPFLEAKETEPESQPPEKIQPQPKLEDKVRELEPVYDKGLALAVQDVLDDKLPLHSGRVPKKIEDYAGILSALYGLGVSEDNLQGVYNKALELCRSESKNDLAGAYYLLQFLFKYRDHENLNSLSMADKAFASYKRAEIPMLLGDMEKDSKAKKLYRMAQKIYKVHSKVMYPRYHKNPGLKQALEKRLKPTDLNTKTNQ